MLIAGEASGIQDNANPEPSEQCAARHQWYREALELVPMRAPLSEESMSSKYISIHGNLV